MTNTFEELVEMVVNKNGQGHVEIRRLIQAGELSEAESALILLAASVRLLDGKISKLVAKAEAFPNF